MINFIIDIIKSIVAIIAMIVVSFYIVIVVVVGTIISVLTHNDHIMDWLESYGDKVTDDYGKFLDWMG